MSFIVTNQTTGQQKTVQIGETANLQAKQGDILYFSGSGWQANCTVQLIVGGNTIQWLKTTNDLYGIFQSTPYTVPSNEFNVATMAYIEGFGSDFPWGNTGTIYLINTIPKVAVTFSRTPYGTINPTEGIYNYDLGQQVTIIATPEAGCKFVRWDYNGGPVTYNPVYIIIAQDGANYKAIFTENTFKITLKKSGTGNGEISLTPLSPDLTYPKGQSVVLVATPNTSSKFTGWIIDSYNQTTNPFTLIINDNVEVTAIFDLSQTQYTLTIQSPQGSGTTEPSTATTVSAGTKIKVTALPSNHYKLNNWLLNGRDAGNSNPITITMNSDNLLQAVFVIIRYALTVTTSGGGTVTKNPSDSSYVANTVVTLTANPPEGGKFLGWSGNLSGSTNPATIVMNGNKNVGASFGSSTPPPKYLELAVIGAVLIGGYVLSKIISKE